MCQICESVKGKAQSEALSVVADAMAKSGPNDHLNGLVDQLLDIQEPERDLEAEELYERGTRGES